MYAARTFIIRIKYRRDRRYGMKVEPMSVFHYKLVVEIWKKLKIYGRLAWQGWRIGQKVLHDSKRHGRGEDLARA